MKKNIIKIWLFLIGIVICGIGLLFINKSIGLLLIYSLLSISLHYIYKQKKSFNKLFFYILFVSLTILFLLFGVYEVLTLLSVILIIYVLNKFRIKNFVLFLFLFSFVIRLAFILTINTPPISDFATLLDASISFTKGNYSFNSSSYFIYWAYQIGFVVYQGLLLKIVNSILFLKLINCLVTSLICVLIYLICKIFCSEKNAKIISMLYSCFIFPLAYNSILTNQHMSALLIYFGIYILVADNLKLKKYQKIIISGVLFSIGNIIRPEGIITIFSILLYFILLLKKENLRETVKNITLLLCSYYFIFMIVSGILIQTNIAPNGLKNNAPQWKFVLGFNFNTNGKYSDEDAWTITDSSGGYSLVLNRIKENYKDLPKLFWNKSKIFWTKSSLDWSFYNVENQDIPILNLEINSSKVARLLTKINYSYYFLIFLLSIVGIINIIKNYHNINNKIIILLNQIIVTFGVYLLIEVQSRYSYFIQITIFILATYGIEYIDKIRNTNQLEVKK